MDSYSKLYRSSKYGALKCEIRVLGRYSLTLLYTYLT
nr:MAG TPA: hypothetical protein [Crassvirales sp.]